MIFISASFLLTGIKLNHFVDDAIQDSGVETGSYLYSLYPKMCELLMKSKSDNTVKSYFYAFKRWEHFITQQGHNALPAQPVHVALYLTHLVNNGSSFHPVSNAVYGIKWAHDVNGLQDPTTNSFVVSVLEASKRTVSKKTEKKEPISSETLIEICAMFKDSSDLLVIRDLTMMLLSFSGFLRFDEVSSLRFNDVRICDNFLVLNITKSKTDQYRQSNEILISKGSTVACPFNMFLKYINLAGFSSDSNYFLFRPVYRSGKTCKLINKDKKLSYTAAREALLKRIKLVSPDCNVGLHSFRSGGATAAANANVNERCLKKHGRWKSDSSKDGYIVDSIQNRLQVSQVLLGL